MSICFGQIDENFDDGELNENPTWLGDVDHFEVNDDGQLQLMATEAGNSFIYTNTAFSDSTEWCMYMRLAFAPSNNNKVDIYLAMDSTDPSSTNGYRLHVGETGSEDAFIFERLQNGSATELVKASPGSLGQSNNEVMFCLQKNSDDMWTLNAGYNGAGSSVEFAITEENDLSSFSNFGIDLTYTSSNTSKFYFDNIKVGELLPDTEGPNILDVDVVSANELALQFSEAVDESSAANLSHYEVNGGIGNPSQVDIDPQNPAVVLLSFAEDFQSGLAYEMQVSGLRDLAQNIMQDQNVPFFLVEKIEPGDLLLSEILFNPIGSGSDYVEVFNPVNKFIALDSLRIRNRIGDKIEIIRTETVLAPFSYLAITNDEANVRTQYNPPAEAQFLETDIPGFNNDSGNCSIDIFIDGAWRKIDGFDYEDDLHDPELPDEDGVSLERISYAVDGGNPFVWCSASVTTNYGTPGYANTCFDTERLTLVDHKVVSQTQIALIFDDALDSIAAVEIANYSLQPTAEMPVMVSYNRANPKQVVIAFSNPLEIGVSYILQVNGVLDKVLNPMVEAQDVLLLIGRKPVAGELKISEILFNPLVDAFDYVELYNASEAALLLDSLWIVNQLGDKRMMLETSYIMPADSYVAFTSDVKSVIDIYEPPVEAQIVEHSLPAFNQDEGNVSIGYMLGENFDFFESFDYTDDLHFPLLDSKKGVSLERGSFEISVDNLSNWHSAAEGVHFGTPGYANSNVVDITNGRMEMVVMDKDVFSPNFDGFDDSIAILYNLDKPGYLATVRIFNDRGFLVKNLGSNILLGAEDLMIWDGLNEEDQVPVIGYYIAFIDLFHPDGETFQTKLPFVLADFLD